MCVCSLTSTQVWADEHAYVCANMATSVHAYIHMHMCVHTGASSHVSTCACMHAAYIYMHICTCMHIHLHVCRHAYTHTHTCTRVCACRHIITCVGTTARVHKCRQIHAHVQICACTLKYAHEHPQAGLCTLTTLQPCTSLYVPTHSPHLQVLLHLSGEEEIQTHLLPGEQKPPMHINSPVGPLLRVCRAVGGMHQGKWVLRGNRVLSGRNHPHRSG